ncbi:MAG: DUF362 domain-containing protein [Phycisphaerae bacterium]|nr:DUF362 domain-containing protein [Phycisphaerae bacterium]
MPNFIYSELVRPEPVEGVEPMVSLTRCNDYSQAEIAGAIARHFELLGGLEKFVSRGDSVLLKPNFIAPRARRCAAQTDPAVLLEVARLLKDFGARPFIGDSPAWSNVFACVKALKMEDALKKMAIPVKQLNKPKECRIGTKDIKVGISSIALDADVIINMPKFKTHQQLAATFAIKNMFGCVTGKRKALWHFTKGKNADEFCEMLIEIYKFLNPALTIIDAVTTMDGPGPIRGRARPLGWLIGGTEPIACETVCCKLVNIHPQNIPIIKTASQMGFGCSDADKITILGDSLPKEACMDFEMPRLIPIMFSLPHVFKSICKQVILLAKSAKK